MTERTRDDLDSIDRSVTKAANRVRDLWATKVISDDDLHYLISELGIIRNKAVFIRRDLNS